MQFHKHTRNTIKRNAKRAEYDTETIHRIIDEALICHVAFSIDSQPFIIPTIHVRKGNNLYLHGANTSRTLQHIEQGNEICLSFTHVDGLVLARSVFHHSMNYRSAIIFGTGKVIDGEQKIEAFRLLTEKIMPGRWNDSRIPNDNEIKATTIIEINIVDASAKIRTGGPVDDTADYESDYWAGVIPIKQTYGKPLADDKLKSGIPVPEYVQTIFQKKLPTD